MYISDVVMKRADRFGFAMSPAATIFVMQRAASTMAAQPEALSLAPTSNWWPMRQISSSVAPFSRPDTAGMVPSYRRESTVTRALRSACSLASRTSSSPCAGEMHSPGSGLSVATIAQPAVSDHAFAQQTQWRNSSFVRSKP